MAETTTAQTYVLKGTDSIKVNKSGNSPMLEIGNYHFQLPSDTTQLQQVVRQFQAINWQDLTSTSNKGF